MTYHAGVDRLICSFANVSFEMTEEVPDGGSSGALTS